MDQPVYEFEHLPRMNAAAAMAGGEPAPRARSRALPLVGVIRNPRSHRNKGLTPEMAQSPNVITATPRTRPALTGVLADFARQGIDLLAVDGGDGTVRDVLTAGAPIFGERWPRLVVLPKGKTNALAVDLGLPADWSLADALRAADAGRAVERRPIVVDEPEGEHGQVLGFILGAGIFTLATRAGQTAHRFGAFNSFAVGVTAAAGVAQALFGFGDTPWRAKSGMRFFTGPEEQEMPHGPHGESGTRYAFLMSTLERFPLGMRPFGRSRSGLRYGLIDAPIRRAVALIPFFAAGMERPWLPALGMHRGVADEGMLELDDSFILDGEAFPSGRYRLTLGPTLQFVTP